MRTLSKGEFAAEIGVSPGRISQYIADKIIGEDALEGVGRSARIKVDLAKQQVNERRHGGQALANGLGTKVDLLDVEPVETPSAPTAADEPFKTNDTAKLIQLERLEAERRRNRREAIEDAARDGQLIAADDFRREIGRTTQDLVNAFMGMAPDIANAIAAKFELTQRDVLFEVTRVMNERRAAAATSVKVEAEALPETIERSVEVA